MASAVRFDHVLITGLPGVGKTTLIRKLATALPADIVKSGFYTAEIRSGGTRTGFKIVDILSDKEAPLATISKPLGPPGPQVGKYYVNVPVFESVAMPILTAITTSTPSTEHNVIIVDEIGKMELFSKPFRDAIQSLFDRPKTADHGEPHARSTCRTTIIATIPAPPAAGRRPIPFVEAFRVRSDVRQFIVTRENRNGQIQTEIRNALEDISIKLQLDF